MTSASFHRRIPVLLSAAAAIVCYALIWIAFKPVVFSATRSDFSCFYRAGRMVVAGDGARVYDLAAQREYDQRLGTSFVDGQGREFSLPFVFPPYALALFAPLSRLPYRRAEFVWYAANVGMLLALPFVLRKSLASSDKAIAAELFAPILFVPAVLALMQGQTSILLLLLFALAFAGLDEGKDTLAGCLLALALLKPQLMLAPLVALVIWRRWRALVAMVWAGVALLGLSATIAGWRATLHYPQALLAFNRLPGALGGEHQESMPNLRGAIHILLRGHWPDANVSAITVALSIVLLAMLAILLRRVGGFSRNSYAMVIVFACLLSFHAYLHDTSLLLLPIVLIAQSLLESCWTAGHSVIAAAIGAMYLVPLLPTSLSTTALQMFAAMATLAALLALEMRQARSKSIRVKTAQRDHASGAALCSS